MELSNRALIFLLSAAGAGIAVAKSDDASAQSAGGMSQPVLTPEVAATLVSERPTIAISSEGQNIIVPNGGSWAGAVPESDLIPGAFLNHYQSVRLLLTSSNLLYLMGGLNNVVQTDQGRAFVPAHSYDFWGIQGIDRSIVSDDRPIVAHFDGASPEVLASLGVSAGATLPYHRDHYESTHFRVIEYANVANWVSFGRGYPLSDDEIKRLVVLNASHSGEGTVDPNRIFVVRYDSNDHDGTLDLSIGRGDLAWDVMLLCPDTGACIGTNGLPIGHIAQGSQYIDLPGPNRLVHPMIWRLDHAINILNPETGSTEEFTDGIFIVPRDIYGVPMAHPATPAPVPPGLPPEAVSVPPEATPVPPETAAVPPETAPEPVSGSAVVPPETAPVLPETNPEPVSGAVVVPPEAASVPPEAVQVPPEAGPVPPESAEDAVVPPLRLADPRLYFGIRGLMLAGDYLPNTGGIGMLTFGGRVAPNHYLGGLLGGGYFGSALTVDPDSRIGLPNPDDPHGLIGYAHAEDRRTAGDILLGLEYRFRPINWLQLAAAVGLDLLLVDSNRSVEERLVTQDGTVVDSNSYHVPDFSAHPMGFVQAGVDFRLHPNVSLDLRGMCTFDGDGNVGYGGGAGLTVYFGDTEGYSSGGNSGDDE